MPTPPSFPPRSPEAPRPSRPAGIAAHLRRGVVGGLWMAMVVAAPATAQDAPASTHDPAPRFGLWKMRSEAPAPALNLMTYEPWGEGGMRITVENTNTRGETSRWGYATLFDGVFRPVEGQQNAETAVEFVNARTTRITNRRGGRVTQVIINTLSDDGNVIENEYVRFDDQGRITGVSHATYERMRRP